MKQGHPTEEMLQEYVDGRVTSSHYEVDKHLEKCAKCRKLVVAYRKINSVLSSIPEDEFAIDFEDKIIGALNIRDEKSTKIINTLFISIASLFFIGLIGYILFVPEVNNLIIRSIHLSWNETTDLFSAFVQHNESLLGAIITFVSALVIVFIFALPDWRKIIRALH